MISETFDQIDEFPDSAAAKRYDMLVGLDDEKLRLAKESRILLQPDLLDAWSEKHYKGSVPLVSIFKDKPGLFIFSGDVGTGKTSLAESFGDTVARDAKIAVFLYRLSLKSRGSGTVGEMTRLITTAFAEIAAEAKRAASAKKINSAYILLIDEADALAQSRELSQMHHEDKAGVNALIRGIDSISTSGLPIPTVMCTNRISALDPAVKRRAAEIFEFSRPSDIQRKAIFQKSLAGTDIKEKDIAALVAASGPSEKRDFGFTYSDIMQRFLPGLLMDAFPDKAIDWTKAADTAKNFLPTPPFKEN